MALEFTHRLSQSFRCAFDPQVRQIGRASFGGEMLERDALHRGADELFEVIHRQAGGEEAQSGVVAGQRPQQVAETGVFETAPHLARGILQRLQAVEDQEGRLLPDQFGQALAFVPR
jgi:hypothetical protein